MGLYRGVAAFSRAAELCVWDKTNHGISSNAGSISSVSFFAYIFRGLAYTLWKNKQQSCISWLVQLILWKKENMLLFESWWYIRNKIRHLKMKCFYKGGIVTNLCVLHLEKQIFKHNSFTLSTQGLILESTI